MDFAILLVSLRMYMLNYSLPTKQKCMTSQFSHLFRIFLCVALTSCAVNKRASITTNQLAETDSLGLTSAEDSIIQFDDTRKSDWGKNFEVVGIPSSLDKSIQNAYFRPTSSSQPKPLIVSLHTWSGSYEQSDPLAEICQSLDLNYIHPDFRGPNWTKDACCSELALNDIDDAIQYALDHSNVAVNDIYVIGVSGGGYATLSTFIKSRHPIRKFSAWASISDLTAWYHESKIRNNPYADHILKCTGATDELIDTLAQQRSPLYWTTPKSKLIDTELNIYAGIYDGLQGSVPITHSINFYNKILSDIGISDSSKYVSDKEKLQLLEFRKPLGNFGKIADREICLIKQSGNIKLIIFEGNHEMLPQYALQELLR